MRNLLCVIAASAAFATQAQPATLRVMGFAGSSNWPIFVAQDRGFFAQRQVEVRLEAAASSAVQIASLREGRIDIALTAMDNIVPYPDELFAFLGINDGGRMSLIVVPAVKSYADLRGRLLAVDAAASGYAFVLMEMIARGGLAPGGYELLSVGGSRERLSALQTGRAAGALLNAPADTAAQAAGFVRLGTSADVLQRYQGSVGAARRDWARANGDLLVRYVAAQIAAVDWLYVPAHRGEALQILQHRLKIDPANAERSYAELVENGSLLRKGALEVDGIRAVLELRRRFAASPPASADPGRYYDLAYYEKALAR